MGGEELTMEHQCGTLSKLGDDVKIELRGNMFAAISIKGTFSGVIAFWYSDDAADWLNASFQPVWPSGLLLGHIAVWPSLWKRDFSDIQPDCLKVTMANYSSGSAEVDLFAVATKSDYAKLTRRLAKAMPQPESQSATSCR
jgi:hypothetical protein